MRRIGLAAVLACGAAAAVLAHGIQDPKPQPTPQTQPQPVFRTGVEIVRLDVRFSDADGNPIRDIRPDEIRVLEGDIERPTVLFHHVVQPVGSYTEVAQRTIASEVSTNQGAPRGNVYALVFDQGHITAGNEQRARLAAERFLRSRVKPGDRVALYAVPGPGPQIEFTADAARAARELVAVRGTRLDEMTGALGSMRVYDAYEVARGNQDVVTQYANRLGENPARSDLPVTTTRETQRTEVESPAVTRRLVQEDARTIVARADAEARRFLQDLAVIVRTLREVDGRKSVILFSEGFEIDNVRQELEEVAAAAAQSYCLMYALDLNSRAPDLSQAAPRESALGSEILSRMESLGSLVGETDGELFNDAGPRTDVVLNRIAAASQDYYLVGFEPSAAALQNRDQYHRVRVVTTRAGARVSARTGYAVGPQAAPSDRRRAIEGALRAPFSQQGLRVEYTTYVLGGAASGLQRVILSLAAELPIARPDASPADVIFSVRDISDGRVAASGSDTLALPDASRPGSTTGTGYYRVQFELRPGIYLMRAVVREPGGLVGSADRRFQVRALGGPSVTASDLILGSADTAGLPVRATAYGSDVLTGVLELYARTTAQIQSASVDVELVPFGAESAVRRGQADLLDVKTSETGFSRGATIELPLEGIEPGEYVVRAVVRAESDTAAEVLRDLAIVNGARPPSPTAAPAPPPDPSHLLEGELARQWIARLRQRAAGTPLQDASGAAERSDWPAVASAVEKAGSTLSDADALLGLSRFGRRNFSGAASALKAYTSVHPDDATAAFVLGWAHAAAGDDRAAVGAFRSAMAAEPTLVPPYLAAIDAYLRMREPSLALQVARAGLIVMPQSPELRDRVLRLERK